MMRKNPTIDMLLEIDGSVSTLSCGSKSEEGSATLPAKVDKR